MRNTSLKVNAVTKLEAILNQFSGISSEEGRKWRKPFAKDYLWNTVVLFESELGAWIDLENSGTIKEVRKQWVGNDFVLGVNMIGGIEGH